MNIPRFIQIHSLHTYPAALINRGDDGLAKRKRLAPYDAYPADGWEGSRSPCRRGTVWVPYSGSECVIVSRGADECT